ncbi:MAG TPA: hypothetical protein VN228_16335 [Pyrinomonadaceae bacterium]|nr:hypothetical protein [Pyrinomonadaceae bacterium]
MRPKLLVLTVALALGAGFVGHEVAERLSAAGGVEAHARAAQGGRWEYCAVTKAQFVGSARGGQYWITYFRGNNVRVETIEAGVTENALAKAVSRLGDEGWEMVAEGTLDMGRGTPPAALYFKRSRE